MITSFSIELIGQYLVLSMYFLLYCTKSPLEQVNCTCCYGDATWKEVIQHCHDNHKSHFVVQTRGSGGTGSIYFEFECLC